MKPAIAPSALKVQAALGPSFKVLEFSESTKTAADAASAIGCAVDQIAKSLMFRALNSGKPVLVIASGPVRVDEGKVAALIGDAIKRADPEFVRDKTGFAIGGVPPIGHAERGYVLIDETLLRFPIVWAAAGTPNAVFSLTPSQLVAMTGGVVADVVQMAR
jgi:prolyl-tRNA editing enzyme YbaK/EbsC (Cys-tRNA(Pro) deacylase)